MNIAKAALALEIPAGQNSSSYRLFRRSNSNVPQNMKSLAIALTITLSAGMAISEEPAAQRPRDRYQQPIPVDDETAKKVIAAIQEYRKILASKDYRRFYRECVHSSLKKQVTEELFSTQIATVPEILGKFLEDVVETYAKKGSKDVDFQIGTMPDPKVPGTLMVQFADRIDAEPKQRWPQGAPVRIQMADDNGNLRFYDFD
jgi:hypothetical protein